MINVFNSKKKLSFRFYLLENDSYKETITKLIKILKFIEPRQFCFGDYDALELERYDDIKWYEYDDIKLNEILKCNWAGYEDYILHIQGIDEQALGIRISPFLKEVSIVIIEINNKIYDKNKESIMALFGEIASKESFMMGSGDPSICNPYFDRGRGHIDFGVHWIMWFGEWSLKYLNENKLNLIKENTCEYIKNDNYVKAQMCINPWKYRQKSLLEKYRILMKKLRFEDVIIEYGKADEFTSIEKFK